MVRPRILLKDHMKFPNTSKNHILVIKKIVIKSIWGSQSSIKKGVSMEIRHTMQSFNCFHTQNGIETATITSLFHMPLILVILALLQKMLLNHKFYGIFASLPKFISDSMYLNILKKNNNILQSNFHRFSLIWPK